MDKISLCLATVTWVYISVILIELWPSISWIYRMSTSASNSELANVRRNIWGVICCSIAAREVYLLIILRTVWSDKGVPDGYTKKWLDWFLMNICFYIQAIFFDICIFSKQRKQWLRIMQQRMSLQRAEKADREKSSWIELRFDSRGFFIWMVIFCKNGTHSARDIVNTI